MTPEQQAAYVFAQSVCALIEVFGMLSDNMQRITENKSVTWIGSSFTDLVTKYCISRDDVLKLYQQ